MLKSPVLSTPVQRALAGAAATGGADQSGMHSMPFWPSEGADQSSIGWQRNPSEGADQSSTYLPHIPSEGADQSANPISTGGYGWHPSEA